jgi:hypothetical protein
MDRTRDSREFCAALLALCLVGAGCAAARAPQPAQDQQAEPRPQGAMVPARPPMPAAPPLLQRAELIERLRMPLSRDTSDLHWEPRPGGSAVARLRGRAQHAILARVGADGRVQTTCVDDLAGAERALAGGGAR